MYKELLKTKTIDLQEEFVLNELKGLIESTEENGSIFDKERQMRTLEGFNMLFNELGSLPQGDILADEMQEMGEKYLPAYEAFILECAEGIAEGDKEQETILSVGNHLKISEELFMGLYEIAKKTFDAGMIEDARKMFQAVAQINSSNYEPWYSLGNCDMELGDLDYAISDFKLACLYDEENIPSYLQLYNCYKRANKLEEADYILKLTVELINQNEKFDENKKNHYLKMVEILEAA